MSEFKHLSDENFQAEVSAMQGGVILAHKKLCPHCKNMMKVLERFSAFAPEAELAMVDSEEDLQAKTAMQAERVPTVGIVKNGSLKVCKSGLMNPQELLTLYQSV